MGGKNIDISINNAGDPCFMLPNFGQISYSVFHDIDHMVTMLGKQEKFRMLTCFCHFLPILKKKVISDWNYPLH